MPGKTITIAVPGSPARIRSFRANPGGSGKKPRTGGGQVYSAKRDHLGRKQRCVAPLTFIDTPNGRYIAAKSEGWLRVQPADFGTLARMTATMP